MRHWKDILKITAGLFILTTVCIGYHTRILLYELTFLFNFLSSIVLITDGIFHYYTQKYLRTGWYHMLLVCGMVVFITCHISLLGFGSFSFKGAFFFLHAINPPLFTILYLFTVDDSPPSPLAVRIQIFMSPLWIFIYLLFDYTRYLKTGTFVYDIFPPEALTPIMIPCLCITFYLLMVVITWCLITLNHLIHGHQKSEIFEKPLSKE